MVAFVENAVDGEAGAGIEVATEVVELILQGDVGGRSGLPGGIGNLPGGKVGLPGADLRGRGWRAEAIAIAGVDWRGRGNGWAGAGEYCGGRGDAKAGPDRVSGGIGGADGGRRGEGGALPEKVTTSAGAGGRVDVRPEIAGIAGVGAIFFDQQQRGVGLDVR